MKIIVGTRGSDLALSQTKWVIKNLRNSNPNVEFEIKIIKTKGDRIQNIALDKIGDKGLFVKEIEEQLLNKEIDIAVHSMKDMPSNVTDGLKFAAVPKREDYRDVLVLREGYKTIYDLPRGAKIGTGSKRRKFQLLKYREDLEVVSIRGNVGTRIRKIKEENLDGVVLAAAGLHRLNIEDEISFYIPTDIMLPAPAQGALAIQIRENDESIENIVSSIKDDKTCIEVEAERAFLHGVDGGCHIPVGAFCTIDEDRIKLEGLFGTEDGSRIVRTFVEGSVTEAKELGYKLADIILEEMKPCTE